MRDFDRSRDALNSLIERHSRIAAPRAWLAKWHVMRVIRGMSETPQKDTQLALEQTKRALDVTPNNALSLAIEGYARCQLLGEADAALICIQKAIEIDPNEPLGWLYKSVWSSMWGAASCSVAEAEHAAQLSPIDPLKYFFDVILAAGQTMNGDHENAEKFAQRALRVNRHHQPALRVLLYAQVESNKYEQARETLQSLMIEVPNLTIANYLSIGSPGSSTRQRFAEVLRKMGVPEL